MIINDRMRNESSCPSEGVLLDPPTLPQPGLNEDAQTV
jgi:hypothetical protein